MVQPLAETTLYGDCSVLRCLCHDVAHAIRLFSAIHAPQQQLRKCSKKEMKGFCAFGIRGFSTG
eukprot:1220857-Prorocentrum_lima.AAC.1